MQCVARPPSGMAGQQDVDWRRNDHSRGRLCHRPE